MYNFFYISALDPDNNKSIFIATKEKEELPTYVSQLSQTPPSSPWPQDEREDYLDEGDVEEVTIDTTGSSVSFEQEPVPSPKSVELVSIDTPKPQEPVVVAPESVKKEQPEPSPTSKLPKTSSPAVSGMKFPYPMIGGLPHTPILSPHVMSHGQRPSLIIPPPGIAGMPFGGFQVPYPVSPALLPQSPFRSPLISPDIHSPSLLPHMEALKENIVRLEQHRQRQHQRLLEHQNSVEYGTKPVKRRKKRRSTKESDKSDSSNVEGAMQMQEGITNQMKLQNELFTKDNKPTEFKHIPIPTPNLLKETPKEKVEKPDEIGPNSKKAMHVDTGQTIHPAVVAYLMRQNSHSESLDQLQNNNNTLLKLKSPLSLLSSKEEAIKPVRSIEEVGANLQRKEESTAVIRSPNEQKANSVTVVRQNSHEIPYYQATSLEPSSLGKDEIVDDLDDDTDDREVMQTRSGQFEQFNLSDMQREVSCSSRTEMSSARDSYSPISSPSDTEVDLKDREVHPHACFLNYPEGVMVNNSSCASTSVPYSPHDQSNLALPLIPTVISSSAAAPASAVVPQNCAGTLMPKPHKKRGRPPGTKMLSRPLGPSDIHAGVFRANHLWKFLLEMLEQPQQFGASIQWLDRAKGELIFYNFFY